MVIFFVIVLVFGGCGRGRIEEGRRGSKDVKYLLKRRRLEYRVLFYFYFGFC